MEEDKEDGKGTKDGEKLQDAGISLAAGGRFLRWLDNYWYHYKWRTVIALFFVGVLLFCILQQKGNTESDGTVTYAGGCYFSGSEIDAIREVFNQTIPADYSGDGQKYVDVVQYTVYSQEEIEAEKSKNDESSTINPVYNGEMIRQMNQFLLTGECSVWFCSPYGYEYIASHGNVCKLEDVLGKVPANAADAYAVRLQDTALYRNNEIIRLFPENTLVILLVPYAVGQSSKPEVYAQSEDIFRALVQP